MTCTQAHKVSCLLATPSTSNKRLGTTTCGEITPPPSESAMRSRLPLLEVGTTTKVDASTSRFSSANSQCFRDSSKGACQPRKTRSAHCSCSKSNRSCIHYSSPPDSSASFGSSAASVDSATSGASATSVFAASTSSASSSSSGITRAMS